MRRKLSQFGTGLSQIGWQEAELRAFLGLPGWRSCPVARLGLFLAPPGWDGDPVARLGSLGWRPVANQYPVNDFPLFFKAVGRS